MPFLELTALVDSRRCRHCVLFYRFSPTGLHDVTFFCSFQTLAQHFTDAVLEAGWLEKRGGGTRLLGNTRYKRRWFELVRTVKGLYLTYQVEPGDGMLKGAIKMVKVRLQVGRTSQFSLLPPLSSILSLPTPTRATMTKRKH